MLMSALKSFYFIRKAFPLCHFTDSFRLKRLKFLLQMFSVQVPDPINTLKIAFENSVCCQHTKKSQIHKIHVFKMFTTAVCVIFFMKLRELITYLSMSSTFLLSQFLSKMAAMMNRLHKATLNCRTPPKHNEMNAARAVAGPISIRSPIH